MKLKTPATCAMAVGFVAFAGLSCADRADSPSSPSPAGFPASASMEPSPATSVLTARDNPDFNESDRISVEGTRNQAGRCVLSRTFTPTVTGEVMGERVVQIDRANCRFTIARGKWARLPGHDPDRGTTLRKSSRVPRDQQPVAASQSNEGIHAQDVVFHDDREQEPLDSPEDMASGSYDTREVRRPVYTAASGGEVWQQLWFEDPINLNVTESRVTVSWPGGGGCEMEDAEAVQDLYWLTASGWTLQVHDVELNGTTCTQATGLGWAVFRNGVFCFWDPPTWNSYYLNQVKAKSTGSPELSYSFEATEGCSDWLSPEIAYYVDNG